MRVGVHLSLGPGYGKALAHADALGCTTIQIFTHSPRMFKFKDLDPERQAILLEGWESQGIDPVVSHASYLINIAAKDERKFQGALSILAKELEYAQAFGCKYVVFHVGKHTDETLEEGIAQVTKALDQLAPVMKETGVMLLLEVASGQGTEIGRTFEEVAAVLNSVKDSSMLGVCIDTCHLYAAGYDIAKDPRGVIEEFKSTIGLDRLKVVHVNDSKFALGQRKDRHEHLGLGHIGNDGLRAFLNVPEIRDLPMILETPIDERGGQEMDLAVLRELLER